MRMEGLSEKAGSLSVSTPELIRLPVGHQSELSIGTWTIKSNFRGKIQTANKNRRLETNSHILLNTFGEKNPNKPMTCLDLGVKLIFL